MQRRGAAQDGRAPRTARGDVRQITYNYMTTSNLVGALPTLILKHVFTCSTPRLFQIQPLGITRPGQEAPATSDC